MQISNMYKVLGPAFQQQAFDLLTAGKTQRATWLEPALVLEPKTMDEADERHRQDQEAAGRRNQGADNSEGME